MPVDKQQFLRVLLTLSHPSTSILLATIQKSICMKIKMEHFNMGKMKIPEMSCSYTQITRRDIKKCKKPRYNAQHIVVTYTIFGNW
jgi:hypothetical protein